MAKVACSAIALLTEVHRPCWQDCEVVVVIYTLHGICLSVI